MTNIEFLSDAATVANPEQADVDRSAERASSAVEVGATNSPERAQASLANGPCEAVSERTALVDSATGSAEAGVSGQPEMIPALTGQFPGTNVSGPERAGVTAGETATSSRTMRMTPLEPRTAGGLKGFGFTVNFDEPNSAAPAVEQAVTAPQVPRPAVTAEIFPDPLTPGGATAATANQVPKLSGAKSDVSHVVGQGCTKQVESFGHLGHEPAGKPQDGNSAVSGEPASVNKSKPDCLKLKNGHCRIASETSALCSECNNARMKGRAAA